MKNNVLFVLLFLFVSACAPIVYTLGGQSYPTADEALAAQRAQIENILSKVVPRETPYSGRAIVFIPSDADIRARGITRTGTPSAAVENYVAAINHRALALFQEIVMARDLFQSVELREVTGINQPEIAPGEHGIWARLVGPSQSGWKYFNTDMAEPEDVPLNNSLPLGGARYVDWLDRLAEVVERNGGRLANGEASSPSEDRTPTATPSRTGGTTGKIKRTLD